MIFTSKTFTYKAYTYTSSTSGINLDDITIKLDKQRDGTYNISPNKILVKIHAAALNPLDVKLYNVSVWPLNYFLGKRGLGEDYSGTIVAIGEKVKKNGKFKVGDLVQGLAFVFIPNGTFSEYILVDTSNSAEGELTHAPKNISLTDTCAWPEVYASIHKMTAGVDLQDKKVLVLGGGSSVGRYLIQYLKVKGAKEIYATASPRSETVVKELGAKGTIDYTKGPILNSVLELVQKTEPFDIILDCVGSDELFPKIKYLFPKLGGHYGTIVGDSVVYKLSLSSVLAVSRSIRRSILSKYNRLPYTYRLSLGKYDPDWIESGRDLIEEGKVKPFIDSYYKFSELDKALARLESGKVSGKVILKVEED
ncbi:chaperonin 10-like protein [Scheffersomyces coipomensis]|uniref:chaperonin 10-like protein n=1 Tax=Scheffersomyces coipomensis TaxID=1788519 RepID=UPI00315C5946